MKVLITGARGQLGREWIEFCRQHQIIFEAFDSQALDITQKVQVEKQFAVSGPDVVINCAGYTKVDQAEDETELAYMVNEEGVRVLAETCKALGIKLVHYSTDYVFAGSISDRESFPDGYTEDSVTNPINEYGKSKRAGEVAIMESEVEYLLLRVSWLCGRYGNNFVKTMLTLGRERDSLKVVNDQFGSPTFTRPVVEQTFRLIEEEKKGTYHLSSSGICTWFDFAAAIFKGAGLDVNISTCKTEDFPTKARRPAFSKLSTQKISTIAGINIPFWEEGLTQLLADLDT